MSFIGIGMEVVGSVDSVGVVSVAGTVHGNVRAATGVLVARGGKVDGDVRAHEVVLDGEISGSIVADRVEVQSSAVIRGAITTPRLTIHEGADLDVELVLQHGGKDGQTGGRAHRGRLRRTSHDSRLTTQVSPLSSHGRTLQKGCWGSGSAFHSFSAIRGCVIRG